MKKLILFLLAFLPVLSHGQQTLACLEPYQPMYFLVGDNPAAKFQVSFKFKLLTDDGWLATNAAWFKGLTFAYTQRSLWAITEYSSPFYDTSYMPELFYETPWVPIGRGFRITGHAGYGHESNGKDGPASKSINKLTATVSIARDFGKWTATVTPTVWYYIADMSDNPDMQSYRGYGDLTVSVGRSDGLKVSVYGRAGYNLKRGAVQIDATYPIDFLTRSIAVYFTVQYWNGYGESMLDYNKTQQSLRAGISFVR